MTEMTEQRLAEIRKRADAATPGPWWAWNRNVGWHIAIGREPMAEDRPDELLPEGFRTDIGRGEDAIFIATARADVPALLDEVDHLRATIARLDADHAQLSGELATERERLRGYEQAEAIQDETQWKRLMDGQDD